MDLFRVLGTTAGEEGARRIVAACLAYLLNPDEDHGLGASLLWRVLRELEGVGGAPIGKLSETVNRGREGDGSRARIAVRPRRLAGPWSTPDELDFAIEIEPAGKRFTVGFVVDTHPAAREPVFRFTRAAKELRPDRDGAGGGTGDGQDRDAVLVHLVPPDRGRLRGLAAVPEVDLGPCAVHGPIALPWLAREPLPELPRSPMETRTSMERLLQQVLLAHVHGMIPSADARALDLVRDLRSACLGGFESPAAQRQHGMSPVGLDPGRGDR